MTAPHETVTFDSETEIEFAEPVDVQELHRKDLSCVLETTVDGGQVEKCVIDLRKLLEAVTVYSAQDEFRFGWRRRRRERSATDE